MIKDRPGTGRVDGYVLALVEDIASKVRGGVDGGKGVSLSSVWLARGT
jgi:hypothetical protein